MAITNTRAIGNVAQERRELTFARKAILHSCLMTQGYKTSSSNFVLRQSLYLASQDDFLSLFVQFLGSWVSSRGELRRYGSRGANRQSSKSLAFVTSRHCGAPSKDSALENLRRSAGKSDRGQFPVTFGFGGPPLSTQAGTSELLIANSISSALLLI